MKTKKELTQNSYNAIALDYEKNYGVIQPAFEYANEIIIKYKKRSNIKILDLGCGSGTLLKHFEDNLTNPSLIGVDFSKELIAIAKKKVKSSKFVLSDIIDFNPNDKFDIVISTFALIHLPTNELEVMINRIYEWLVDDGYFYSSFILGKGERLVVEALDSSQKTYFNDHTEEYLTKLLENVGFKIIKRKIFHSEDEYENEDDLYLLCKK